jgi:hypothetical protein
MSSCFRYYLSVFQLLNLLTYTRGACCGLYTIGSASQHLTSKFPTVCNNMTNSVHELTVSYVPTVRSFEVNL